ncbi:MAG: DUF72 domain-containing protein [Candidatus Bathyarchaeota archaeon]|jgi:uncharacterized protein YecE (DUF72 family)|nr:DUF72 domain-containing protein [Candidatus Bathyarchaeota archaeon]
MKKYYENFSLVELNSTFYQYPRMETVEGWRKKAPETFEFTVKAHQDISHKEKMKVTDACLQAFEKMKKICKILNSKILLIQTPGSFRPEKLGDAEKFFKKVNRESLILVWETRGPAWETPETYQKLKTVLEKVNVSHVTDPFRVMPAYVSEIAYFRLHGLGEQMYYYQYSDEELQRLKESIMPYEKNGKEVYVLFNNLSMFEDAIRFREYLARGKFPKVTSFTGLQSLREVLAKTRYPISKSMLIKKVGWRVVEVKEGKQERLNTFLADLPSKTYQNVEELLNEIKSIRKI